MRFPRRLISLAFLAAIILMSSFSLGRAHADEPTAYLRATHFLTGAPNVDVYVDGKPVLTNVSFQDATAYVPITPGKHVVNFGVAGKTEGGPAAAINLEAAPGDLFTYVFSGTLADKAPDIYMTSESGLAKQNKVTIDNTTMPLLFVQGSKDAGNVDVYINDALVGTVKNGYSIVTTTPFQPYKLKVTPAGDASKTLIEGAGFGLSNAVGVFGLTGTADKLSLDSAFSSPQSADKFFDAQKANDPIAFNTLLTSAAAANLSETLAGPGPMTIFAPTDKAFAKLDPAALEKLQADPQALGDVLKFHIIGEALNLADVVGMAASGGSKVTLQGAPMNFSISDAVYIGGAPNPLLVFNIHTGNAIIHVSDTLLMPPTR